MSLPFRVCVCVCVRARTRVHTDRHACVCALMIKPGVSLGIFPQESSILFV